jgi:hypothetical protein
LDIAFTGNLACVFITFYLRLEVWQIVEEGGYDFNSGSLNNEKQPFSGIKHKRRKSMVLDCAAWR